MHTVPNGARREYQNWDSRQLFGTQCHGCQEPTLSPPEEQGVLSTAEPSLQPPNPHHFKVTLEILPKFIWKEVEC